MSALDQKLSGARRAPAGHERGSQKRPGSEWRKVAQLKKSQSCVSSATFRLLKRRQRFGKKHVAAGLSFARLARKIVAKESCCLRQRRRNCDWIRIHTFCV